MLFAFTCSLLYDLVQGHYRVRDLEPAVQSSVGLVGEMSKAA